MMIKSFVECLYPHSIGSNKVWQDIHSFHDQQDAQLFNITYSLMGSIAPVTTLNNFKLTVSFSLAFINMAW